jgi:hypothetical protein
VRDRNGKGSEKTFANSDGEVYRREIFGPHGIVEQCGYQKGKPVARSIWSYDDNGPVTEFHQYDQSNIETQRSISINGPTDHNREEWEYRPNGTFLLHFVETYDSKSHIWTFTNLNENGSERATVSWITSEIG